MVLDSVTWRAVLVRALVAALGGVLLAGAFEPVSATWLAPLGVATFVATVAGLPARRAWIPGLAFGVSFFHVLQVWMIAVGPDAWLGLSMVEAAFFAPLGAAVAILFRVRWGALWIASAWVAVETVRSGWPFSGMPWGRLSYAVADTVWATGLPWFGFTGVSFLIALTGALLAVGVLRRPRPATALVVALTVAAVTLLPAWFAWNPGQGRALTVAVVQGDVPGTGDDLVAVHREVTGNHVAATVELARDVDDGRSPRPDLVLWPENSTAVDPFRDVSVNAGIQRAAAAVDVPVLVGAMVDSPDPDEVLNQGIVWDPLTGAGDRYTKLHPVPFGEYIPWRDVIFRGNLGKLRQIGRDMVSGTRPEPLRVGGVPVADAICFDVAYDDGLHAQVRRGAELVVVQTSNAMFIHTHQVEQQYEITRLRALETGRPVAVAATNGISAVIDSDGSPVAEAAKRTTTVLVEEVTTSTRTTPAVLLGPWPGRTAVLVTVAVLLASRYRRPAMPYARRAPTEGVAA